MIYSSKDRVIVSAADDIGSEIIEVAGAGEPASLDFLVPLGVVPALARGAALHVPGISSDRLRSAVPQQQRRFCDWNPSWRAVPIVAALDFPPSAPSGEGLAAFFSGGVDSFFTALSLRDKLDALIWVEGFDLAIGRPEEPSLHLVRDHVRSAARELGLPLVEVATTVRRWSDARVLWGDHYVGSAMAAIALILGGRFGEVLIPSTHASWHCFAYGTAAKTDEKWSTELVRIRHHGAWASRPEKVRSVAQSEAVLRHLRVCWENPGGAYNCGTCEKCVRTKAELLLAGVLDSCETMDDDLDIDQVRRLPGHDPSHKVFLRDLREAAEQSSHPRAQSLADALDVALGGTASWGASL